MATAACGDASLAPSEAMHGAFFVVTTVFNGPTSLGVYYLALAPRPPLASRGENLTARPRRVVQRLEDRMGRLDLATATAPTSHRTRVGDAHHAVRTARAALLPALAAVLAVGAGCASYAPADAALDALESDALVTVVEEDDWIRFDPATVAFREGVVFYPGALVEPEAYAPPLRLLAEQRVTTVLVRMPSNLAVLKPNAAEDVFDAVDGPASWVIAGHSLGGAMAAQFAAEHPDLVVGLAMWASYPPAKADMSDQDLTVTSVTATGDLVLDPDKFEETKALLPADTTFPVIEGGNHAGFGSYGPQKKDGEATITPEAQHELAVDAVVALLERIEGA